MSKTVGGLEGFQTDAFAGTTTGNGTPIAVNKGERFTISADYAGSAAGDVNMERRLPGETTFNVIETYTGNTEKDGIAAENMELRLSVATHTVTGTITLRLGG